MNCIDDCLQKEYFDLIYALLDMFEINYFHNIIKLRISE